jgi:CRISPR-associated protein Cas2
VARLLEKKAIRIQYSLFFYPNVTQMALESLVDELLKVIDEELDDVRIYRVDAKRSLALMSGFNLTHPKIFL